MEGSPAHQGARTEGGLSLRSSSFLPSANIAGVFLWDKLCARLWGGGGRGRGTMISCHLLAKPGVQTVTTLNSPMSPFPPGP